MGQHPSSHGGTALSYTPSVQLSPGPIDIGSSSNHVVLRMFTPSQGWAVGPAGKGPGVIHDAVLVTGDGGARWTNVTPPGYPLDADRSEYFLDANYAWVAVSPPLWQTLGGPTTMTVFRTSDGGRSWQRSSFSVSSGSPAQLFFVDTEHGWLATQARNSDGTGGSGAYRTMDGGRNWQPASLPERAVIGGLQLPPYVPDLQHSSCESVVFASFSFVDPQTGWSAGRCYSGPPRVFLRATADGGNSWHVVDVPAPPTQRPCPCVTSATLPVFTTRQAGTFVVMLDQILTICLAQPLGGVGCQSESKAVASFLYATHDGGSTWAAHELPARSTGGDISFPDGRDGFFAGSLYPLTTRDGIDFDRFFVTHDGGVTWTVVPTSGPVRGGSLQFVNASAGWALRLGQLVRSTDGGRTWTTLRPTLTG
jgi:photosystem II stability/assembly factor-like uncharacterized protein